MGPAIACETWLPVQVEVPRSVARFNRVVTNPIQGCYAWLLPPWVVICHRGRRSGRLYRTPVIGFGRRRTLAIVVLYGERSDWVQNVLAGGAQVVRHGRTYELRDARLLDPEQAGAVSPVGRAIGRLSDKLLVAELGERRPGFGRGPR
jgi:deazaflavin-dependent oxidoreductase (nitroreductase family)